MRHCGPHGGRVRALGQRMGNTAAQSPPRAALPYEDDGSTTVAIFCPECSI